MTELVAFGSIKGTGGVTATALAYAASAASDGQSVTLIEADPSGGSLLGWCPSLEPAMGLYEAVWDRERGFDGAVQPLGELGVVVAHGDPWRINVALSRPRAWRPLLDQLEGIVVVDLGRLYPGSPAKAIAGEADRIVLVTPAESAPLAATLEWLTRGGQFKADDPRLDVDRIKLATADTAPHRPQRLDPSRLSRDQLGACYVAHLPYDDAAVDLLCRGASFAHRSLRRSSLGLAVRGLHETVMDPTRVGAWR